VILKKLPLAGPGAFIKGGRRVEKVSEKLEENKAYLQGQFAKAMDFMMREMELSGTGAAL